MPQNLLLPEESFDQLIRNKTHKTRVEGALLHIYNVKTGLTEYILKKNPTPGRISGLVPREVEGRMVMIEEDIEVAVTGCSRSPAYSDLLVDQICELLVEGHSLKKICSMPQMPSYSTLMSWRRSMPWIQERMDEAREDRGEYLRDMAMEALENANVNEDNIAVQVAKHKALVWAAGVDNGRFSPKAKFEATINQPTQIIVNTGIGQARVDTPAPEQVPPAVGEE
jgi:hypothetical protein